ncbi:hypothetical protein CHLRE_14g613652v5 [Chlamydomonas reinhardtii]|uniref:Uncharacterized protein n=1 Tax=Chlamydomonas reinhardtii TaxID=3055 RepID=A0A2K3CXJ5_CHLRE|nr:uncharacterized protein CHLRE_14g613652v5 [Chlamydomonas reinhardtii]PNW72969.1 hypothetical protein CHLRE_14g613652v5 [Chlamydomonas reinhardtii]
MGQCLGRPNAGDAAAQQAFSDVRSGATTSNTAGTSGAPSMATAGTAYATPNSRTTGIRATGGGGATEHPRSPAAATSSRSTPAAATPSMSAMSPLDSSVAASTGHTGQRHPAAASDARGYRTASQSHTHERHGKNLGPDLDAVDAAAPSAPAAAPTAPADEPVAEVRDLKEKLAAAEGWCKEMQKQLDAAQASHAAETRRQRLEADLAQARRDAQAAQDQAAAEMRDLEEQLTTATRKRDEMQEQLKAAQETRQALEAGLQAAQGDVVQARQQLNQQTQQLERVARERQQALAQAQQARAAQEQAGAARDNAVHEVNDLLTLGVIDQPNPELFRGPVRFGAAAHARLMTMVLARGGTGQRLGPGWAFKTDTGAKLHKAKCGNQESFHWYHYSTLTGRNNTEMELCDKRHCQWAFEHEEAYLVN